MIGEGDTLRLAAKYGLETQVSHCLAELPSTREVVALKKHDTFTDAYRLFLKHKFHRLPIIDGNGRLQGLVSRSTILTLFVEAHYGKHIQRQGTR
jgi:CBS-domain-containing membrane protein